MGQMSKTKADRNRRAVIRRLNEDVTDLRDTRNHLVRMSEEYSAHANTLYQEIAEKRREICRLEKLCK